MTPRAYYSDENSPRPIDIQDQEEERMTEMDRLVILHISRKEVADVLAFMKLKQRKLGKIVDQMNHLGMQLEPTNSKWKRCALDYTRNLGKFLEYGPQDELSEEVDERVAIQEGWDG